MNGSGTGVATGAFRAPGSWIRSWRKATWVVVIWGLALFVSFQLFARMVAPREQVAYAFHPIGILFVLLLLAWFVYAVTWGLSRLAMLARRLFR